MIGVFVGKVGHMVMVLSQLLFDLKHEIVKIFVDFVGRGLLYDCQVRFELLHLFLAHCLIIYLNYIVPAMYLYHRL